MSMFTSPSARESTRSQENNSVLARKAGILASARKPLGDRAVNPKTPKQTVQDKPDFTKVSGRSSPRDDEPDDWLEEVISMKPPNDFDSAVFEDPPLLTSQDIYDSIKRCMMTPPCTLCDIQVPDIINYENQSELWPDEMEDSGIKMDFMDVSDMSIPDFEDIDDLKF